MVKTRVHDLAAEFGIPPEQLLGLLKDMNIFVRSHMSALEGDQVNQVRVRWEREKRKSAEDGAPKKGRRKAAKAPEPAPMPIEAKPAKRRRTAAEVAVHEAQLEAEKAAEMAALELERPLAAEPEPTTSQSLEERARALFKELPPAGTEHEAGTAEEGVAPMRPANPFIDRAAPARGEPAAPAAPSAPPGPGRTPFIPPRIQRPAAAGSPPARPGFGGGPNRGGPPSRGPRPVFSSATGAPGRPAPERTFGPDAQKGGGRKKGKKGKHSSVDQDAVQANILKTLQGMKGPAGRKGGRRSDEPSYRDQLAGRMAEEREREKTRIHVNEFISVSELAGLMKVPATQIVQFAFKELGLMVTVNQRLDFDQIELIASQFGFEAVREDEYAAPAEAEVEVESGEAQVPRPPVVTIMGHVDHGKTSLLDYIRKANIVAGEAGGITQHIGAYHVALGNGKAITFLDTPGHQAFTAMRARGAEVTDIVVLVVAADDQVMPQTVEAISHARNAGVPMIVAINKIDLPSANVPKVKQDLLAQNVVLEDFGGQVLSAEISAKKGTGVPELLEQIVLQAEILDLKANPNRNASGNVVEAQLDPGKGPVATVLVSNGTLKVGDDFICGMYSGRVRALLDERGKTVKAAGPAIPVQVLGMTGVPMAGDQFVVVEDATESREIAQRRQRLDREAKSRRTTKGVTSLEDFMSQTATGQARNLRIVIKADQGGPAEALADALQQLSNAEVKVDVIHRGVGAVTESDILLAKASGAIIIGFHVRPDNNARAAADREGVDIKLYRIIYEAVADVRAALEGLLRPEQREIISGEAEVRELFKVPKIGVIAGCSVRSGVINRTGRVRVIRDGTQIYDGIIGSLRRFKEDVREVREGFECGIGIENFNDLKNGDVIEAYRTEEVARTLQPTQPA